MSRVRQRSEYGSNYLAFDDEVLIGANVERGNLYWVQMQLYDEDVEKDSICDRGGKKGALPMTNDYPYHQGWYKCSFS